MDSTDGPSMPRVPRCDPTVAVRTHPQQRREPLRRTRLQRRRSPSVCARSGPSVYVCRAQVRRTESSVSRRHHNAIQGASHDRVTTSRNRMGGQGDRPRRATHRHGTCRRGRASVAAHGGCDAGRDPGHRRPVQNRSRRTQQRRRRLDDERAARSQLGCDAAGVLGPQCPAGEFLQCQLAARRDLHHQRLRLPGQWNAAPVRQLQRHVPGAVHHVQPRETLHACRFVHHGRHVPYPGDWRASHRVRVRGDLHGRGRLRPDRGRVLRCARPAHRPGARQHDGAHRQVELRGRVLQRGGAHRARPDQERRRQSFHRCRGHLECWRE
jgi:hypothetical protein